jgi:hypothetical protein
MSLDYMHGHEARDGDGSHLTKRQQRILERYCERLLKRLDLSYWKVFVACDLPPEDALLMISPTDGRRTAGLCVSEGWWERQDAEQKRIDLTHEMLHLAHHDQEEVIRTWKASTADVAPYVLDLLWERFNIETERMTDSLSYVLAPHMPPWKAKWQ